MDFSEMLTVREAAKYLGCSVALLRLWKRQGRGPKVFQVGGLVRYRRQELDEFVSANLVVAAKGDGTSGRYAEMQ